MSALTPLSYQLGVGGIGGFIAGYALKKFMKIVAVIIGLFILALVYLGYRGIITVNYGELGDSVSGALGLSGQAAELITPIIAHLPFAGAFGLGFFLGFKMG
ncbi:MAG TPA: FUN14 domain-containing protein [Candidatus Bathyarchaeia archaeon]|nr:FUN14 domain-containing protein [Candidatus Bathyarchaeia archaeon]